MRKADLKKLEQPYTKEQASNSGFDSAIGSDAPSAIKLADEIFNDLDPVNFGIGWWTNSNIHEKILISDYLYKCADDIQTNLTEAKIHYLEWLATRDAENKIIENSVTIIQGKPFMKHPPVTAPIDELAGKMEKLHICGFFQAIGSTLDCLGGAIIGILALPWKLRRNDFKKAEELLKKIKSDGSESKQLQIEFSSFLNDAIQISGEKGWLDWADQYRNVFVHRGRRVTMHPVSPNENLLFDGNGQRILKVHAQTLLAKNPDRSEIESLLIYNGEFLSEDADDTLKGLFKSTRDFVENVCERLSQIWSYRRLNPTFLEQPLEQWSDNPKNCEFEGYNKDSVRMKPDDLYTNPKLAKRIESAGLLDDSKKSFWSETKWTENK